MKNISGKLKFLIKEIKRETTNLYLKTHQIVNYELKMSITLPRLNS